MVLDMRALTSRERLTRLFSGQEIDRVPIWLLNPVHPLSCYTDVWRNPHYAPIRELMETACDHFDRRWCDHGFCYNANPEIVQGPRPGEVDGEPCTIRFVRYRDFELTAYTVRTRRGLRVKYLVDDPAQLLEILKIPYVAPLPDVRAYEREKAELGSRGLMMFDLGDALGALYSIMSAQDFSMATATDYDIVLEFLDEMHRRVHALYRYMLERSVGEVFFIVGAEFAGPPIVSPARFHEMSARYVKELVDLIRSYGRWSIVHYHGQLRDVLDGMRHASPDGLHTIEAPPIGNCTITQARQALGDTILIGNIQYDDLARLPEEQIAEMTRSAVEEGKAGRFILSPTAGPYEETPGEQLLRNYRTFVETGLRYGGL